VTDSVEAELRAQLRESSRKVREVVDSAKAAHQPGGLRSALREAVQRRETAQHQLDRHLRSHRATPRMGG